VSLQQLPSGCLCMGSFDVLQPKYLQRVLAAAPQGPQLTKQLRLATASAADLVVNGSTSSPGFMGQVGEYLNRFLHTRVDCFGTTSPGP